MADKESFKKINTEIINISFGTNFKPEILEKTFKSFINSNIEGKEEYKEAVKTLSKFTSKILSNDDLKDFAYYFDIITDRELYNNIDRFPNEEAFYLNFREKSYFKNVAPIIYNKIYCDVHNEPETWLDFITYSGYSKEEIKDATLFLSDIENRFPHIDLKRIMDSMLTDSYCKESIEEKIQSINTKKDKVQNRQSEKKENNFKLKR
ncbi:hypothetical protein ACQ1Q5_00070 [Ornithobacterium rhinotracheale]